MKAATLKKLIYLILIVAGLLVISSCGVDIDTIMSIKSGFAGSRVITVDFNTDDDPLSHVDGGFETCVAMARDNLPSVLSMTYGDNKIVFTLEYTSKEDYTAKVEELLAAGKRDIAPIIQYENSNTEFKQGIRFNENFNSADLIWWYYNALCESGKVDSTDDWYSLGSCSTIIDGATYEGYNTNVDNYHECCLDRCEISTYFNADGTYTRKILIYVSSYTQSELIKNGCNVQEVLSSQSGEGISLTVNNKGDDGAYYEFEFTCDTAQEIGSLTNKVLKGTSGSFSAYLSEDSYSLGYASLDISECIDGAYYFDTGDYDIISTYYTYENAEVMCDENTSPNPVYDDKTGKEIGFTVCPVSGETYSYTSEWHVSYGSIEATVGIKNLENTSYSLKIGFNQAYSDELNDIAKASLSKACEGIADIEMGDDSADIVFKGTIEEVYNKIDQFISRFTVNKWSEELSQVKRDKKSISLSNLHCGLLIQKAAASSKLKTALEYYSQVDWSPAFGKTNMNMKIEGILFSKLYPMDESISAIDNGFTVSSDNAMIQVRMEGYSPFACCLLMGALILVTCGIIVIIIKRHKLREWIKCKREKRDRESIGDKAAVKESYDDSRLEPMKDEADDDELI